MSDERVIAIVGPTASGKSSLAEAVAEKIGCEIVSADSMQIYRGMDIGTAKQPVDERKVPYHCIDILDPGEAYSAALFQRDSRAAFSEIRSHGKTPILCGGTGFYVRAALDEMDFAPGTQIGNEVRARWESFFDENGAEALHERLAKLDPPSADLLPVADVKRVIRALEMHEAGESYAERKKAFKQIPEAIESIRIGLAVDPEILRKRIDERVDAMLAEGLIDEVEHLLHTGFRTGLTAPAAIGYKEIVSYLDGDCSLDEAVQSIKTATRRYAKRQRTWFRGDGHVLWVNADRGIDKNVLDEVLALLQ